MFSKTLNETVKFQFSQIFHNILATERLTWGALFLA